MSRRRTHTAKLQGFSIIELMVVVSIIGLLSVMSWPSFQQVQTASTATRLSNDFRVYGATFETHALEEGEWAEDGEMNQLPDSLKPYFVNSTWYDAPPTGGFWDWDKDQLSLTAAVSLVPAHDNIELFIKIDRMLDDGNLATGNFIKLPNRYIYILER